MARRTTRKRSRTEKIWIAIGVLVAVSMVLAFFAPSYVP
jgi:hypothetical protein